MSGFKIVDQRIEDYVFGLHQNQDEEVLLEMEARAREQGFPIISRLVGPFLEVLTKAIGAKRVFEFGSGYGYSAYWFSRAVGQDGKVFCTEGDQENVDLALEYLKRVGRSDQVEYHCGWAQKIFPETSGEFDVIYNDVDKMDYPEVWQMAKDRIRSGGLYICDNVLWSGRVTQENPEESEGYKGWTEAIQKHNQMIANDPEFDFFFNPMRDGVLVARKK